jgi:hypothetical protein
MVDKSRRNFFKDFFFKRTVRFISETCDSYQRAKSDLDYFQSFESAHTLISENLPFIEEEVERLRIDTEGKSTLEIVKEIYEKSKTAV